MADGKLAARSEVLGLDLRVAGRRLRFHAPQRGRELPDLAEAEDQRREAEARVEQEAAARQAAEARLAELEALLRRRST